jgi:hypothetical protein
MLWLFKFGVAAIFIAVLVTVSAQVMCSVAPGAYPKSVCEGAR